MLEEFNVRVRRPVYSDDPLMIRNLVERGMGFAIVPVYTCLLYTSVLASGSLKEVASVYGVSYPTVRLRLDRLIQKIQLAESAEPDGYVALIKRLAVDDKLDVETAKLLIGAYRKTKEAT